MPVTSDLPFPAKIQQAFAGTPKKRLFNGTAAIIMLVIAYAALQLYSRPMAQNRSAEFPFVEYTITNRAEAAFPGDESQYTLTAVINPDAYRKYIDQLESTLLPASRASGDCVLGLPSKEGWNKSGILEYGQTSPVALSEAIHKSLGIDFTKHKTVDPEGCVILLGQRIQDQPWGLQDEKSLRDFKGGKQRLTTKWFWVSPAATESIAMRFRQVRTAEVHLSAEGSLLTIIRPQDAFEGAREQIRQGTGFLPGGPMGRIGNLGVRGGKLTAMGALDQYERAFRFRAPEAITFNDVPLLEQERVILLMPGFWVEGEVVEQAELARLPASLVNSSNLNRIQIHSQPLSP